MSTTVFSITDLPNNITSNITIYEFTPPNLAYAVPVGVLLIIFTVLTVAGNLMVLVAVATDRQLRAQRHSLLIANLAVFDMTLGWSVFPFSASLEFLNDQWIFGRLFCTVWAAVDVLCCTGSIWSLVSIALDRLVGVTRPLAYAGIMTRRRMLMMICAIWTLSLIISVVPFMGWSTPEEANPYKCNVQTEISYVMFSVSVSYYIPLVIILVLYARIWRAAARHVHSLRTGIKRGSMMNNDGTVMTMRVHNRKFDKRPMNSSTSSTSESASRDNNFNLMATPSNTSTHVPAQPAKLTKSFAKQRKATITLTIIIFGFICMWQGFFLVLPLGVLCPVSCQIPVILWKILFWLGYCNSLMNPFIYAAASPEFRRAFKRILCCAFISNAKRKRNLRYEMTLQPQRPPSTLTSTTCSTPVSVQRLPVNVNSSPLSLYSYTAPSISSRRNACFQCLLSCCGRFCPKRRTPTPNAHTCHNCGATRRQQNTKLTSLHRTSSAPHDLATLNQNHVSIPRRRFLSFNRRKKQDRSADLMEDFPLASMTLARLKDPNTPTDILYGSLQALQKIAMEENPARTRHNSVVVLAEGLDIPVMTSSRSLATQTPFLPTRTSTHSLASSVQYIFVPSAPDDAQL